MLRLQSFPRKDYAKRRMVVDDDRAIAVQDFAARRDNRQIFNTIFFRQLVIKLRVTHLQVPEASNQKQENRDCSVLKYRNAAGGKLRIVARGRLLRSLVPR